MLYNIDMCYICKYFTGPSALTVNIIKNIESASIVVQWDAVDLTTYTIFWTNERDLFEVATVTEQTSYTITGLTLDTVYTITVSAANMCGDRSEFRTSISFPTGIRTTSPSLIIFLCCYTPISYVRISNANANMYVAIRM